MHFALLSHAAVLILIAIQDGTADEVGESVRHPGRVHAQGKIMTLEGRKKGHAVLFQRVKVRPGTRYKLHFWGRGNRSWQTVKPSLGDGKPVFLYEPTGWWNEFTVYLDTPDKVPPDGLDLKINDLRRKRIHIDDVTFTGPDGKNILQNGQFEDDRDGDGRPDGWQWTTHGDFTVAWEDWSKYLGRPDARMKYYQYKESYLSPDITTHFPTGLEYDFKGLSEEDRPLGVKLLLDLPEEVSVSGFTSWGWGGVKPMPRLAKKAMVRDGKPYVRYRVVAPVDREQCYYPGNAGIVWFLKTTLTEGTVKSYYHLEWPATGKTKAHMQPEVALPMRVVRIPKVDQPKNIFVGLDLPSRYFDNCPGLIEDLRHLGVNLLDYHPNFSKPRPEIEKRMANFRQAGFDLATMTVIFKGARRGFTENAAVRLDGARDTHQPCHSYRGKLFDDSISQSAKHCDLGINCFVFDDEYGLDCFCQRCLAQMKTYFLKQYPALPKVNVKQFFPSPKEYPNHHQAYKQFRAWQYGKCVEDFRSGILQYVRKIGKGNPDDVKMIDCVFHGEAALPFLDSSNTMAYINYEGKFSPKKLGDDLGRFYVPGFLNYPLLCSGLVYEGLDNNGLDPQVINKYQILESLMAGGFKGFAFWASNGNDLLDYKYMAEAIDMVNKIEHLLPGARVVNEGTITESDSTSARLVESGNGYLLLVGDYSTYEPEPTEALVLVTTRKKKPLAVVDVETGKKIATLHGGDELLTVPLKERRARLFHLRPE